MEMQEIERKEAWLPEFTIKLIEDYLNPFGAKVFEFGSGGSTKWFCNLSHIVYSVEDNEDYYDKIISDKPHNLYMKHHKLPYNCVIDEFEDNYFDLILVDGRNRQACIRSAIPKLKSGGWLVLDNSERDYYKPAIDMMADWNQIICKQNRPDKYNFTYPDWQCTIFIKP